MKYGYFCEDEALETFIENVFLKIGPQTKCKEFIVDKKFCDENRLPDGRNSTGIKGRFDEITKDAFDKFGIDLYITAYDFDDNNIASYPQHIKDQVEKIDKKIQRRSILCIPIKSIEYWLYYVKHQDTLDALQKEHLENDAAFNRHIAKANVYDGELDKKGRYRNQSVEKTELPKAKAILENLDIDKLRNLSPSFNNFVEQIIEFCRTYA